MRDIPKCLNLCGTPGAWRHPGRCAASPGTSPILFPPFHPLSKAFNVATSKRHKAQLGRLTQHKALCHLSYRKSDYCKRYLHAKEMCPNLSDTWGCLKSNLGAACWMCYFGPTGTGQTRRTWRLNFVIGLVESYLSLLNVSGVSKTTKMEKISHRDLVSHPPSPILPWFLVLAVWFN